MGPLTGDPTDADPTHRCAVRLTSTSTTDHTGRPSSTRSTGQPITQITWAARRRAAVPAVHLLDHRRRPRLAGRLRRQRRARNIVPADHGIWMPPEDLGTVPAAPPAPVTATGCSCGTATQAGAAAPLPRYYPAWRSRR